jgi:hypothetical protein
MMTGGALLSRLNQLTESIGWVNYLHNVSVTRFIPSQRFDRRSSAGTENETLGLRVGALRWKRGGKEEELKLLSE